MQSIFDGFSKRPDALNLPKIYQRNKSSTSPNIDSRCSSVTMEQQDNVRHEEEEDVVDVQSIQIAHDIHELASVVIEDTIPFLPNIQYGKVLEVYSGSEFLIAARIYNGYTKVLRPQLYRFRIKLHGVSGLMGDDTLREELASMILDKIVIVYRLMMDVSECFIDSPPFLFHTVCCLGANVYLGNRHINDAMNAANVRQRT